MPDAPAQGRLDALIAELALRLGTRAFAAHLTLLPGLPGSAEDALRTAAEVAAHTPPLTLELPRAAHGAAYYRCVFLEAEPVPELLGAHQRARRAFGGGPDRFAPHVSMVYGRLQERVRDGLAREVARALELPLAVRLCSLEVQETRGDPSRWRACGRVRLHGPNQ